MGDEGTGPPLKRRVPGAARAGPAPSTRRVLPDTLIARMQAAVDAAHEAQGAARAAADAEPATQPLPVLRAAVAAQDWANAEPPDAAGARGDAWAFRLGAGSADGPDGIVPSQDRLDDLTESYLAADPDLTAGYADDAELDTVALPALGPAGLDPANPGPAEPGADVRAERAPWWDHAVESGRATRPSKARQRFRSADATTPVPVTEPAPQAAPEPRPTPPQPRPAPPPKPERTLKPVPPRKPERVPNSAALTRPEVTGRLDSTTKPERPARPPRTTGTGPPGESPGSAPAPAAASPPPATWIPPAGPRSVRPAGLAPRRRPRPARAGAAALAVVLIAGGVVALVLSGRDNAGKVVQSGNSKAAKDHAAVLLARQVASAAGWVAAQVSRTSVVACDPATCQALAQHGFPASQLTRLGAKAAYPLNSTIVVDTPALRRQFGTSLASNWAPAVLAGFGRGADRITVRVTASRGAAAYESALRADRQQRQAVGSGLLTSRQIAVTPAAKSAMAAGDVDARMLIVITALASQHPIEILAFGRTWSGTTTGIPLRTGYFAASDPAAYLTQAAYTQAMISLLKAQPAAYRPVRITLVRLAGQPAVRVEFPAPSPLGLISPNQ